MRGVGGAEGVRGGAIAQGLAEVRGQHGVKQRGREVGLATTLAAALEQQTSLVNLGFELRSSHAQSTHWPFGSSNTDSICAKYIASSSAPGKQYTGSPVTYFASITSEPFRVKTSKPS